ncbi:hypothetical protein ACIGLI_15810 [Bacillus subtilis]|nr:hypothetical protein [Bacillus subtilis]MDI6686109.1 hypothetical protein [Bacillus subtilis]MED4459746.1 hypothetical protein [Bacillus subtilis]CAF1901072.1 hypothetical protein NRS6185_04134 [Bacillus subtilis]SPY14892.1 Uncharacterised protein [Bacillus subtilis]
MSKINPTTIAQTGRILVNGASGVITVLTAVNMLKDLFLKKK